MNLIAEVTDKTSVFSNMIVISYMEPALKPECACRMHVTCNRVDSEPEI